MKKLITLLLAFVLIMPAIQAADTSKATQKALKKEKSEKMKEYKKKGWEVFGTSRSLEVALLNHYERLAELGGEGHELVGIASRFKSKSIGHQMAINDACITYAQHAGSALKGRVISDLSGDGVEADSEFDHFFAAYERLVEKEIKGEMEESYSVIRDLGDGTYELQTFFIYSESAASKARVRALNDALKENEAAQRNAEQISSFVRDGFEE
jgi:hypothetical protein